MKKRILAVIIAFALIFTAQGCGKATLKFNSDNAVFDIDTLKDLSFTEENGKSVTYLYGNGIVSADYVVSGENIIIKKGYLATLSSGEYEFTAVSKNDTGKLTLTVKDNNRENKIVNGSFETADYTGWDTKTVFKGE